MSMLRRSTAAAPRARNFTPRRASGIRPTMIKALKMTADRIADRGDCRSITFRVPSCGNTPTNIAGMMAKYFATSLAMENVVSEPRVISSCLPTSTISMSFVGFESRSTMFPASFAAWVPVFIATPTSACASAGASLVPSPVIATSLPSPCSRFANDRRRLAGDGAFVDRRDPLDDLAVGRDHLAGGHPDDVAFAEQRGRDDL